MGVAFESARAALHVSDTVDPVLPLVANKIIELARAGERNADLLCERAAPPATGAGARSRLSATDAKGQISDTTHICTHVFDG